MRKLKKALSLVLAIALVLGLCTIGAAAIETPNGEYEGGGTIEYHVTANDLSKLLAVKDYGANAEVDKLTLKFKEDLTHGIDSLDMIWNEAADTYGTMAYSNYMNVQPNCIKSLTIKLADGRNLEVTESELTANYIGTGSHIYELSLTEADETYLVTFWAQQGNDLHWTRYSVVAVEKGGTVGDKMPADPDTGNYVFIGWELSSHDGSGSKFTADTVVNADIDVYARKVSVGGGSAYHVMNPDTELNAYAADKLGAASAEAVTIDSVRVNGQDEEATNPSYTTNGWKEHNGVSYFYIYNDDAYAASFDPQYNNTRVPANEVTSITLFCTLNGEQKEVNIGIDELELAVVSDVIVEIRLHKSGDGDFIITASAGENGSISPVGKVSVAAGADQSFSFLPSDGFTVDTLTVNNTTYENNGSGSFDLTGYTFRNVQANGSIHVTFAADANDNDIPDYKETKYDVTYQFVSGTDGKELPESDVPAPPSDNTKYLTGITVTNKGKTTYKPVSADDGNWTFTGWDANQKEMSKDGITFTGTWTFTPNIRNGSTVVVDEGKGVTLLYAISLTGTPGAEYAITDTGADVADGYAPTGEIPEAGVGHGFTSLRTSPGVKPPPRRTKTTLSSTPPPWRLTDNPNEPGQESTEEVDVVIDWDDPNVPVVPSDPDDDDDDDDEDEDDEVFVPNWLNTEDHYSYIVGYEDGTIKPNNNITRAEVATIFYRLLTDSSRERWYTDSNSFTDVADDSWYNEPVSTLSRMGIINGYEDGSFKPNAPITRAEFTAIATRFFDYSARYDGAFYDVSAGSWYADYIQAAVDMGLVEGYPDGGVHPGSNITRAEAVTIVNRVLNRVPHEDHLLSTRVMNTWPDNKPGAWYYADMQEATNSHDYDWTRVNGQLVEDWTNKLADPNW